MGSHLTFPSGILIDTPSKPGRQDKGTEAWPKVTSDISVLAFCGGRNKVPQSGYL